MKAMILAAGRGERMGSLTDATPKPLLRVGGRRLIEYSLESLRSAGFSQVVINIAYLGVQIREFCGDGGRWGLSIEYSDEGERALETAGGIAKALPLLGGRRFLALNADVICDYPLAELRDRGQGLAHLVMIDNPPHHAAGDFALQGGVLSQTGAENLTFSGIGVYEPALFAALPLEPLRLRPVLEQAMLDRQVRGEHYRGFWRDIGSPGRLQEAVQSLDRLNPNPGYPSPDSSDSGQA